MALTPYQDSAREAKVLENYAVVRRVEIPLFNTHQNVAGLVAGTYRVPGDMRLEAFRMRGHISGAGITTVDTMVAAALNCRVALIDQDTQVRYIDQTTGGAYIRLSDILPVSGEPLDWTDVPLVIPQGHTLRIETTLDVAPGAVGEFGVIISGVLVAPSF
jgi:hypothetical protein